MLNRVRLVDGVLSGLLGCLPGGTRGRKQYLENGNHVELGDACVANQAMYDVLVINTATNAVAAKPSEAATFPEGAAIQP